jgi:hypothetical protein
MRSMARYFFNLTNGKTVRDPDGEEFADLDAAKASAIVAARDFARNKLPLAINGVYVSVADESGTEVFRVPLQ